MMQFNKHGRSDLLISELGFGCMSLEAGKPHNEALLLRALDAGVNYFDTADMYQQGENEKILGRAFRKRRKEVILATKVGNRWRSDGSGWDWVPSKKYILAAVDLSLARLQTDYIDLYQLHGGTLDDPIDEIIEIFDQLRAAGKIRYYGISSIRPNVIREYVKRSSIISVMMQYSLLDRRPEEGMLSYLHENSVGVLARGSIAKGLLVSKPAEAYLNYTSEEVRLAASAIRRIRDHAPFSSALKFVLQHPAISSAVVGIRTEAQLSAALRAVAAAPLLPDEYQFLQNVLQPNIYNEHR